MRARRPHGRRAAQRVDSDCTRALVNQAPIAAPIAELRSATSATISTISAH